MKRNSALITYFLDMSEAQNKGEPLKRTFKVYFLNCP